MNVNTLKDSFELLIHLNYYSLFTNIPLGKADKICLDELFKPEITVSELNKK